MCAVPEVLPNVCMWTCARRDQKALHLKGETRRGYGDRRALAGGCGDRRALAAGCGDTRALAAHMKVAFAHWPVHSVG